MMVWDVRGALCTEGFYAFAVINCTTAVLVVNKS